MDWSRSSKKVCAICLQTSVLKSDPHEIIGKLKFSEGSTKVVKIEFIYKAGIGGQCKHISEFVILLSK